MARRIEVSRTYKDHVVDEIVAKIKRDKSVQWKGKAFAEKVKLYLTTVAWDESAILNKTAPGTHPYETGSFIESITVRQSRRAAGTKLGGRFIAAWEIHSSHPHANFIEYGTGDDRPNTHSPWGRFTPTPEYAPFARTAHHFGGTAP